MSLFRNVVVAIVKIMETKRKTGCQLLAIDEPAAKLCPEPSHSLGLGTVLLSTSTWTLHRRCSVATSAPLNLLTYPKRARTASRSQNRNSGRAAGRCYHPDDRLS